MADLFKGIDEVIRKYISDLNKDQVQQEVQHLADLMDKTINHRMDLVERDVKAWVAAWEREKSHLASYTPRLKEMEETIRRMNAQISNMTFDKVAENGSQKPVYQFKSEDIDSLGLPWNVKAALAKAGIKTISDIRKMTRENLCLIHQIGVSRAHNIKKAVADNDSRIIAEFKDKNGDEDKPNFAINSSFVTERKQ